MGLACRLGQGALACGQGVHRTPALLFSIEKGSPPKWLTGAKLISVFEESLLLHNESYYGIIYKTVNNAYGDAIDCERNETKVMIIWVWEKFWL